MNSNPIKVVEHQEHRDWLSQLDFYQDQVLIFQKELTEVVCKHPHLLSIIEHVDEYRKILITKLDHIDDFRYEILLHEKQLSGSESEQLNLRFNHEEVRSRLQEFIQAFEQFKKNFRRFAAYND
jgi:hypothetical protein